MHNKDLLLICGLLIILFTLPNVEAVICKSFMTRDVCERTMTSSGGCKWQEGIGCVKDPTRILPAGYAAIASVEVPEFLENVPSPEDKL